MVKDDGSSENTDDGVPMVPGMPSLSSPKNDTFSLTEEDVVVLVAGKENDDDYASDDDDDNDDELLGKNMCGLNLELPSLRARLESSGSGLVVDTRTGQQHQQHQQQHLRHEISASDSYDDDYVVPIDPSFYASSSTSPPTSRKTVKLDDSKTPTAALSVGGKGGSNANNMDFEILPDETDDEDEDEDDEFDDGDDDDVEDDVEDENDNHNGDGRKEERVPKRTELIKESGVENDHATGDKRRSSDEEINAAVSPAAAIDDGDQQATDSFANPSDSSATKPMSRRRFLFAPKSPRSSRESFININSLHASTTSDPTGNNAEKPRGGQRLTTMIRKMKASRKDNRKSDLSDNTKHSSSVGLATPDLNMVDSGLDEQDSSSDESSFDDDENWSDDESQLFDDDIDQPIDCSTLRSNLPKSFLDLPPDIYDYLDSDLVTEIENQEVSTYAWEHHLYVKGLIQLLAERDLIGVEDDVLDAHNVTKMGVLRKKDAKIGWRVKYVEVRKGNLTYFDNKGNEKGRTIHLRKRRCVCRITSSKEGGQDTLFFELVVDGGRRLLWAAQSEEECQGWVRAINQAMIGEVDDSRDIPLDLSLYRNAIDDYQTIHSSLKDVHTRQEYLVAMNTLLYRQTSSSALRVPMKWIRDKYLEEDSKEEPMKDHERIKHAVREFWQNLCNTSVVLNGHLVQADGVYSGERAIGALSRCILEFDKVENTKDFDQIFNSLKRSRKEGNYSITELQAVSYARNILNGALRSTSRGDIRAAVEELFRNDTVAHAKLESSEPLHIYVSYAGDDFSESKPRPTEFVGWIETKSKKSKKWKMRYFVLSEGVLSYFERANPRPYRLSGQMVLRDAKFKTLEGNVLSLAVQNRERLFRFSDRGELIKWKSIMDDKGNNVDALNEQDFEKNEEAQKDLEKIEAQKDLERIEAQKDTEKVEGPKDSSDDEQLPEEATKEDHLNSRERSATADADETLANGKSLGRVRGAGAKFLKKASLVKKRAKDRTGARMKSIRTGAGLFSRRVRGNPSSEETMGRRPTSDMLISSTRNLNALSERREPTVQAVVEMNSTFEVMAKHTNNGNDQEEEILL